jgi:hypothetical protein
MSDPSDVKQEIREVLLDHVGKENAIHSGEVAEMVGVEDEATHVRIREHLTELLEEGLPLASNPALGYWIIENQEELDSYVGSLERRARGVEQRKINVLDAAYAWPDLDLSDDEYMDPP